MDENISGKNIKYLRESYGDTLKGLGKSLNMARNTLSGYESDSREPDLDGLNAIAQYFGRTTDELLNVKFYEGEEIDSKEIVTLDDIYYQFVELLPLVDRYLL